MYINIYLYYVCVNMFILLNKSPGAKQMCDSFLGQLLGPALSVKVSELLSLGVDLDWNGLDLVLTVPVSHHT